LPTVVEMRGITKRFPGVLANDHIHFQAKQGEIHALLGENGAGKTTLMNILYGLYQADEGEIYVRGQKVAIRSPQDAINLGIGMVHQHFLLIPPLTVTQNIVLGLKSPREPFLDLRQAAESIAELSAKYGLKVDPHVRVWQLSVGSRQRVEIIKALYRGAKLLILDEPTSVLTPQEVKELFAILRSMAEHGNTIIFITHKLDEVMSISHRVTVLRDGQVISTVETQRTDKQELARMMVGREVLFRLAKRPVEKGPAVLEVRNLQALSDRGLIAIKDVSFSLQQGEILGIAGVGGNGQSELAEVIVGVRKATGGKVLINGKDLTNRSPQEIIQQKVAHIPEDRMSMGLVRDFTVAENMILETHATPPFARGWLLNQRVIDEYADKLISDYDIKTPSREIQTKLLSGGNLQKLILARALSREPQLLIAVQPTRGLDVGATEYVRRKLLEQREKGRAILFISADLDEVLSMSDRIAIMCEGEIVGIVPAERAEVEEIGLMMAGGKRLSISEGADPLACQ
jgi:ABC-type uncharacterized transport system ATPase subunit